jgi:3-keto-L-gulonate-6-phosphate decarboxylase
MTNTTKIITILELHGEVFKAIHVDTTPMLCDCPDIDSLDLENWAVEKNSTDSAAIVNVAHFETYAQAQEFAKRYLA